MEKIDAFIDAWLAENADRFQGLSSFDFNEKYNARQAFKAEVKKLIKGILEASDYQLDIFGGKE